MTFVQLEFVAFFVLVFTAYWIWPNRRWQNLLLTTSSLVFYGWVHPWFLALLTFSAVLDFGMALGIRRWPGWGRWFLAGSLCGNLGLLGFFKYFDFFVANVGAVLQSLGFHASPYALGLLLPVGISFYTFQTLSYTIDVYRGRMEPRRDFLDYCTFIMMFPHLVAGPVMRARELLPQVEAERTIDGARFRSGLTLALWGAAKKIMIADTVALYVDRVFAIPDPPATLVWAATLGFAVQILADFSGYTDIARGTARMLGYELMVNFRHPYLARSPSDFWRRWHISFSSWIHEYVYEPLRGQGGTERRRTAATYAALLLSGLWHGASWNFVLWGGYHATVLVLHRQLRRLVPVGVPGIVAVPAMFAVTLVGWLLFRERDLSRLIGHLTTLPSFASPDENVVLVLVLGATVQAAVPLLVALWAERWLVPRLRDPWTLPAQTTSWALCAACISLFSRDTVRDFIYFHF